MTIFIIIIGLLMVTIIGFIQVYHRKLLYSKRIEFTKEYRQKFYSCSEKYYKTYDRFTHMGSIDNDIYEWLTMNAQKIQSYAGNNALLDFKPAFNNNYIHDYLLIVSTMPKFRDGSIEKTEVGMVDDSLLRYLGELNNNLDQYSKFLKNPFIWFINGFREILSIPILILNWFGVINIKTVNNIKYSLFYKIFVGIVALIAFVSSIITIINGYEQTIKFINDILK